MARIVVDLSVPPTHRANTCKLALAFETTISHSYDLDLKTVAKALIVVQKPISPANRAQLQRAPALGDGPTLALILNVHVLTTRFAFVGIGFAVSTTNRLIDFGTDAFLFDGFAFSSVLHFRVFLRFKQANVVEGCVEAVAYWRVPFPGALAVSLIGFLFFGFFGLAFIERNRSICVAHRIEFLIAVFLFFFLINLFGGFSCFFFLFL